jgi:hypothetical protein
VPGIVSKLEFVLERHSRSKNVAPHVTTPDANKRMVCNPVPYGYSASYEPRLHRDLLNSMSSLSRIEPVLFVSHVLLSVHLKCGE